MRGGVQFAISAFPLGGYVKMGGDDPRDRSNLKPGDLFAAAWWRRVVIALAGPGANFILAIVLAAGLFECSQGTPGDAAPAEHPPGKSGPDDGQSLPELGVAKREREHDGEFPGSFGIGKEGM